MSQDRCGALNDRCKRSLGGGFALFLLGFLPSQIIVGIGVATMGPNEHQNVGSVITLMRSFSTGRSSNFQTDTPLVKREVYSIRGQLGLLPREPH